MVKEKEDKIVWKDVSEREILISIFLFIIILLMLFITYIVKDFLSKFFFGIFLILLFSYSLIRFKRKLSFITEKRIFLGNITFRRFASFESNQTDILLSWDNIHKINIIKKAKSGPFGGLIFSYLLIFTKNSKRYEFLVYDTNGFKEALKKLNKSHLLKK